VELGLGLAPGPSVLRGLGRPTADAYLQGLQWSRHDAIVSTACLVPDHGLPAAELVELARQNATTERSAGSLAALGAAEYRAGRYAEAVTTLEEAAALAGDGGSHWVMLFLALAYRQQNQPEKADAWEIKAWLTSETGWEGQLVFQRLWAELVFQRLWRKWTNGGRGTEGPFLRE
jgi:hypothetical protein